MLNKSEIIKAAKKQLAIEFNCSANDLDKNKNVVTLPSFSDDRRKFSIDKPPFFKMVTMGGGAVISANEQLHSWLTEFVKNKCGHWLFEHTSLREIDKKLKPFNMQLPQTSHMFLPIGQSKPISSPVKIKWYEQNEIHPFYPTGSVRKYPNALDSHFRPERPDMLAVAAFDGDNIIGLAGCSADTPLMWQIGIDIDEKYRGKGIGTTLVSMLKDEILARGKIPYYGTSLSNLYSWHIALNCGFRPAWVEIGI